MKENKRFLRLRRERFLAMSGIWFTNIGLSVLFAFLVWPRLSELLNGIDGWTNKHTVLVFGAIYIVGFFLTDYINRVVQKCITRKFDRKPKGGSKNDV